MVNSTKPHPHLLAFSYTYLPEGATEQSFAIINATSHAKFVSAVFLQSHVILREVSFVSAEDGFTLTDTLWNREHSKCIYHDEIAHNARVFDTMDRIAEGGA
jgi:hypothetical protein